MTTLSLVTHFRALAASAGALGLQAQLHFDSLRVEVSGPDRYIELEPEFAAFNPSGVLEFTPQVLPQSRAFTGWRCAPKKSCEVSLDKRAFTAFCARHQVRTPRILDRAADATTNIIVKQNRPGVRGIIRGPFAPGSVPAGCMQAPSAVLLQEFVPGHMLEAWYWDGQLFAVEIRNRPHVTGDGLSSVRELIVCNSLSAGWIDWTAAEDAVRFQGATLDAVPAAGRELAVDIRFTSALQPPAPENVLKTILGSPVHAQLLRAGPVFHGAIAQEVRRHTQFVLGAIIDAQQRLWFTDMITDLRIHSEAYDLMLRDLFGLAMPSQPSEVSLASMPPASPVAS